MGTQGVTQCLRLARFLLLIVFYFFLQIICLALQDFILRIMRLLDSPSTLIRAKTFLTVLEVTNTNLEMIHVACQARLVITRVAVHQMSIDLH